MMKNAMWMAFECHRVQQGFDEREEAAGAVQVDAAEVSSTASECSAEEFDSDADNLDPQPLGSPSSVRMDDNALGGLSPGAGDGRDLQAQELPLPDMGNDISRDGAAEQRSQPQQKVRLQTNSFYDDYLHRGAVEPGAWDLLVDTPLRFISFYDYAMWVEVVSGDPWNLQERQGLTVISPLT